MTAGHGGPHLAQRPPIGRSRRNDDGFTIVEMTIALAILALTAAFFAAQLASSYAVYGKSRERTVAEEIATERLEVARDKAYDDVAIAPAGVTESVTAGPLTFGLTTYVKYVNDPVPGRFATGTNYKAMRVIVTRNGTRLADMETLIAPRSQSSLTKGLIKVFVGDFADNTPIPGAAVTVTAGPSPTQTDLADAGGWTEFAGLTPTPASGPTSHYVLTATAAGYTVLPEYLPNAPAVYPTLAATQTFSTAIQMYKTVSVTVNLTFADGTPFPYPATVNVSSATRGSGTVAVTNGSATFTSFGTAPTPVIPRVDYTFTGSATVFSSPLSSPAVTQKETPGYPGELSSTVTLVMPPLAARPTTVTTHDTLGNPVPAVTVTVTGGDANLTLSGVTDAVGKVVLATPPSNAPYTLAVPVGGLVDTAISQPLIVAGVPVTVDLVVTTPPNITLSVHDQTGLILDTVSGIITGGDLNVSVPLLTDLNGQFIVALPVSTAKYTLTLPAQSLYRKEIVMFDVTVGGPRIFDTVLRLL